MAKTTAISLTVLAFFLCACGSGSSMTTVSSELPEFSDDSWFESIDSVQSYAKEEETRTYPAPTIDRGDGFFTGNDNPWESSLQANIGDIYLHDYGGAAVYIGNEGVAEGKVLPESIALYHEGWYTVYLTSSGYYRFRPQEPNSQADTLQKAFYRTIFALNGHCDYVWKGDGETYLATADVALGAYASESVTIKNGVATRDGNYSWVENGEPFTYYNGHYVEETAQSLWTRFNNQASFRCLQGFFSDSGPLVEAFDLFEEKEGHYTLGIDRTYAKPGDHTVFYYEITLDNASRYLRTVRTHFVSYQEDGSVESMSLDYRFGGFGTTIPVIPEDILSGVPSQSSEPWFSWSRR